MRVQNNKTKTKLFSLLTSVLASALSYFKTWRKAQLSKMDIQPGHNVKFISFYLNSCLPLAPASRMLQSADRLVTLSRVLWIMNGLGVGGGWRENEWTNHSAALALHCLANEGKTGIKWVIHDAVMTKLLVLVPCPDIAGTFIEIPELNHKKLMDW